MSGLLSWPLQDGWIRIEYCDMPLPGLPRQLAGAKLVHLSDLHYGPFVRAAHLHRYVELVNSMRPDIVALTGDFITVGCRAHASAVATVLRELHASTAVVACLGNHDYGLWHPRRGRPAAGLADYLSEQLETAGVVVLRNSSTTLGRADAALRIVGLEDDWSGRFSPEQALPQPVWGQPVIALLHNPDSAPYIAPRGVPWILAGHTHGKPTPAGRLWDAVFPTQCRHFVAGQYSLGHGRFLYVNRGLSNAMRYRPHHRPEITMFSLCRAVSRSGASDRGERGTVWKQARHSTSCSADASMSEGGQP